MTTRVVVGFAETRSRFEHLTACSGQIWELLVREREMRVDREALAFPQMARRKRLLPSITHTWS